MVNKNETPDRLLETTSAGRKVIGSSIKKAFTIDELAKAGPFGRTKLYEFIRDGELIARKCGRSTIILETDYEEFLENLPVLDETTRSRAVPRGKSA
jgi:hypothetical protein